MNKKIAIVTGANSGMGLASTVELARQGMRVIMACRNEKRGLEALEKAKLHSGSDDIELMLCDLASLEGIRGFCRGFTEKYDVLDVLLNNAGVVSLQRKLTQDGFESQIGVNHLGHFLLTLLLIEPLRASRQGRIVNVSSGAYKIGKIHYSDPTLSKRYNVIKGYAQSKLANILFTRALARRLSNTAITTYCLHPGAVATNIGVDRGTGFGRRIMAMLRPFFLTPEQGAETAMYVATSQELTGSTGQYFYKKQVKQLSSRVDNIEAEELLWLWSEQQVGQTFSPLDVLN